MSRIGKLIVSVPKEVKISWDHSAIGVAGPKGQLNYPLPQGITLSVEEDKVNVRRENDDRTTRALHGLARSLIANMVTGVTRGFEKRLEIIGVGYRADLEKGALKLNVGFSHPVVYPIPQGISVEVEKQTQITVKGIDKQKVGAVAAQLRSIKPPEPYKGKGIRYLGEHVRRKVGKTKA